MTPLPDVLPITPFTRPARGEVTLPGSKSLTNRALLLAALCDGPVTLTGALFSEDTEIMAEALRRLGFAVTEDKAQKTIRIEGRGGKIPAERAEIFVGLAGTAARFLTALCAAAPRGTYTLDGTAQMRKRPMKGLLDALRSLGADIRCPGEEGFFPLEIHARGLRGGKVEIDASESSQMLSALCMVAPLAKENIIILLAARVRQPFVEMTLNMMEHFGITWGGVERGGRQIGFNIPTGRYHLQGPSTSYPIEPDATAASYFLALPLVAGGTLKLTHVTDGSLQGDTKFADVLKSKAGLSLTIESASFVASHASGVLRGVTHNFAEFSDTFLTLAAIAPLLEGTTAITGIAHTRKQETDRVAGMARELKKLGQDVVETEDALTITPDLAGLKKLAASGPIEIETYGDHRFAMSFAILGCYDLRGDGTSWLSIRNPGCCAKTFPDFFDVLAQVWENSHPFIIIAIDGGAASGKSSTARALSGRFHLLHVDTGSFYRAVTAELLRRGVRADDLPAVRAALAQLRLDTRVDGSTALMEIDGRAAGDEIRGAAVNDAVSHFAALPEVRAALLAYQRGQTDVARARGFRGLAMEGRDIGSVIFPDADFRFFLFADPAERARRRVSEGRQDRILERDRLDSSRKNAPLALPPGATAVDTTHLTLAQVVGQLAALIAARGAQA